MSMQIIDITSVIEELKTERQYRERCYPRWIEQGKYGMTQQIADQRIHAWTHLQIFIAEINAGEHIDPTIGINQANLTLAINELDNEIRMRRRRLELRRMDEAIIRNEAAEITIKIRLLRLEEARRMIKAVLDQEDPRPNFKGKQMDLFT